MWVTEFEVEGTGAFPIDMLRYDACFPATQESAVDMVLTRHEDPDQYRAKRRVRLRSYAVVKANAYPTEDRWKSFGWVVLPSVSITKR